MKKRVFAGLAIGLALLGAIVLIYPHVTIQTDDKLYACRYSDDISEFETEVSLDERYTYYADRDVTWTGFDFWNMGPFYVLIFDIEEGNLLESQYVLKAGYVSDFLAYADIEENPSQVDVASLISGREPIIGNTRYICPDYDQADAIYYTLNGESQVMYIYVVDDLLVLQVGHMDEGPKFIAYR